MSSSSYPVASSSRESSSFSSSARASTSSIARDSRGSSVPTSHMETTITRLLIATKALLEGLAQWSKGEASEDNISAIYVKLGNDFNVACAAFAKEGILMTELLSVPADLRACLELCLSDTPSQAALERHLPKVRQIVIRLLTGLRGKQKQYRDGVAARRTREASTGGERLRASQGGSGVARPPITPNGAKKAAEDLRRIVSQSQGSTSSSLSSTRSSSSTYAAPPLPTTSTRYDLSDAPAQAIAHPRQPSPSLPPGGLPSGPRLRNPTSDRRAASSDDRSTSNSSSGPPLPAKLAQSRSSTSLRDSSRSSRSTDGGSSFVGGPRARAFSPPPPPHDDDEPVPPTPTGIYLQSVDSSSSIALRPPSAQSFTSSMQSFLTSDDTCSPTLESSQSAAQLEGLEALKSADSLVRRASKRFSAYAIQKMTTGSSASPSRSASKSDLGAMAKGTGRAEGSRLTSAGRELVQSGNEEKRGTGGGRRAKSEFRPGRGPDGERRAIPPLPSSSPVFARTVTTISEESSPRMSVVDESSSSRENTPRVESASTFASTSAPPLPSSDSAPVPPLSSQDSLLLLAHTTEPIPESDYPISVYLQIGRDVKKAQLDELPTIAALRVLFIERFQYNPGHADFPSIYIRDPVVGVQYELEDLSEVKHLGVLSLNIDTVEQVKHHIDQGLSTLAQDIKELRSTVVAMRRASVPAPSPFAPPPPQTSPLPSRPSERQFQDAAQTILKSNRALSVAGSPVPTDEPSPPPPSLAGVIAADDKASIPASPTLSVDVKVVGALKKQHEEVQNLRREVGVLRQVYVDFATQTKGVFATLRAQTSHVQTLAATKVSTSRAFIEAGKAKLEKESTDLVVKSDDLQDAIDQMRSDISLKSIRPRQAQVAEIASTLAKVTKSRDDLVSWIATVKPSWKATWSDELQMIINEQQLVDTQSTLLQDLQADLTDAARVFDQIKQVVQQPRAAQRPLREFVPTPAEEGGGLADVMLEVRGLQPDANRRLEAIAKAERTREVQKALKKDDFADELDGFVSGNRLKKSGGVEEAERVRQARSEATLRSMFGGGGVEPVRPPLPPQTKSSSSIASSSSLPL